MKKILALLLVALFTLGLAACGGTTEIPEEIIDCLTDPTGEGCPVIEPGDERTAEEILADTIVDTWDGELTHLDLMLENMDFEDSMEYIAEFNLEVEVMEEGVLVTHFANAIVTDSFEYLETGTLMRRNITVNVDGEIYYTDVIYEEVETGVVVYVNVANIVTLLEEEETEGIEFLETLGITEDWLMFQFDDTLANVVELEVIKDLLFDIFFLDYGDTFFYDLQNQIELELGVLLSTYGIGLGSLVQKIVDADYDGAQIVIENIDYEQLILDLDMIHLVPEIVLLLEEFQAELDLAGFGTEDAILFIEENGTEAFINDLNTSEISTLLNIIVDDNAEEGDPDLSDMYDAYLVEELDHYIVMFLLNQPELVYDLRSIESFDFDTYKAGMDPVEFYDLLNDLEKDYLIPKIVELLEWNDWDLYNQGFDVWMKTEFLEDNSVESFITSLTVEELATLIDVMQYEYYEDGEHPDMLALIDAINIGEYEQFLMEFVMNDPSISLGLREIPGFDVDVFKLAMDNLDYDAFYLELETLTEEDLENLFDAVHDGEIAFGIHLVSFAVTHPEMASILAAFTGTVIELQEYMIYVDDVNYLIDNLFVFEEYYDLAYYLDNDIIALEVEKTAGFEIRTTATLDGSEVSLLFIDLLDEAYWYLEGLETFEIPYVEHLNCPVGDEIECETFEDYLTIIADLDQLGTAEMVALYDPSNPDEIEVEFDFTNIANSIIALDEEAEDTVNEITIKFTVRETAAVGLPSISTDMNQIAEDFGKVSLNFMTYDFVRDALDYYDEYPLDFSLGDFPLDYYGEFMNPSLAFDANMSFITVGGNLLNPTIACTLYWADGTLVFDNPISLSYLDGIMSEDIPNAQQYQSLLDGVNDDNFHMSKLLLVFVFTEVDITPEIDKTEQGK